MGCCTWGAGEDLSHKEGLGEEALHLAGSGHSQLVLFAQLIHAQNGNDILQALVVLHHPPLSGRMLHQVQIWTRAEVVRNCSRNEEYRRL